MTNKEYNRFFIKLYKILKNYFINKKKLYSDIVINLINSNKLCLAFINFILLFIVFFSLFYVIIIITINVFNSSGSWFSNMFIKDSSLGSYPEYNQISNLIYVNDWFSIDYGFIINFIFIISFFVSIFLIYNYNTNEDEGSKYLNIFYNFNHGIILMTIIFAIYIFIYLYNYSNTLNLSNKINSSMNTIYNNINYDFINSHNLCEYFTDTKKNDNFESGKCNNIISNYSDKFIKNYIRDILSSVKNNTTIKYDDFKDTNECKKIKTALFTNSIIKYFISNNLEKEIKEFLSIKNITNTNFIDKIYKFHINPFLYLKVSDISFLSNNYSYNEYINSFMNNKNLFINIMKDYNETEYSLSNDIVNIYNICRLKMLSASFTNYILFIIIKIYLLIYIIYNYYKTNE